MKAIGFAIAIMLIALGPGTRAGAAVEDLSEEKFDQTFPFPAGGRLIVENYKGAIDVSAADQNEARVSVTKHVQGGSESSRRSWLQSTKVLFKNDSDSVGIKVQYPDSRIPSDDSRMDTIGSGVDLKIQVPRTARLEISGYSAEINVRGTQGGLKIESFKSYITITSVKGPLSIDTHKAQVFMYDVDIDGEFSIKDLRGIVEAELRDIGDGGSIETSSGEVILKLPASLGLSLEFTFSGAGTLKNEFPKSTMDSASEGIIRSEINGGGRRLRFDTYRGTLILRRSTGS